MRLIFLYVFIIIKILISHSQLNEYHAAYRRPEGTYDVYWSVEQISEKIELKLCQKLNIQLDYPLWFGIGFSDRGELENADLFALNRLSNLGFDLHTNKYGRILEDDKNDYQLKENAINHARFCFTIQRKLNTCDKDDYQIDRGTTNIIIFSMENIDKFNNELHVDLIKYFSVSLQLIRSTIPTSEISATTNSMEITVNYIEMPSSQTTYWCKVIQLPKLDKKHHIIKYEAIISRESQGIVHHMELFHCSQSPGNDVKQFNGPCNSESKPMGLTMCRKVIAAWAMGATAFTYPREVGSPIGGENFSNYAILEIHFNNQEEKGGIIDNSGLRLFYTDKLRKYDAGIIELGLEYTEKNFVPPHQKSFPLSGFCTEICSKQALSENGIFIFGSQLHTHLTGVQVETRHFRNNRELKPLNTDKHYQPHYQEIRLLPEIVNVLPGDMLVTTCIYKTTNRTEVTFGGISITDEMCLNYIFYYPKIELELCKSSVSDIAVGKLFEKKFHDFRETFNRVNWSDKNAEILERFYEQAPIHQSCNMSDSKSFKGDWNAMRTPIVEMRDYESEKQRFECLMRKLDPWEN